MPLFVIGFNRFNQLSCLQDLIQTISSQCCLKRPPSDSLALDSNLKIYESEPCVIKYDCLKGNCQVLFSWSYCLFISGETFWLCGFMEGKKNVTKSLKTPNEKMIFKASCNRKQVLCVTEDGYLWQYNIGTGLWKDLTNILHSEVPDDDSSQVTISKVCCGELVTAVLTSKGEVFNFPNKLSLPSVKVQDVACGRAHILLLSDNGQVFSVGEGSRGQLGHGELEAEEEPRLVEALAGLTVVAIACGGWHSCAVTTGGDLYTWGWNMCGQLGLQTTKAGSGVSVQALPVVVDWPGGLEARVVSVACGARHTVTLTDDGCVWGCGWNGYGQLALTGADMDRVDQMTRIVVAKDGPVKQLLCGPWNTCLVT